MGGRPVEEGGHTPTRLSLDKRTREILDRARAKGKSMSELAERCVKTVGEQYDPAQACETAANVVSVVEDDMDRARAESDFDRLQALAELRSVLEPFAGTCEPTKKPEKDGKSDSISLVKRES